jgi:archaellum biogenesis ATPase FlaH
VVYSQERIQTGLNKAEKYGIDLSYEHKTACPRCRRKGKDRSGDNLQVYSPTRGASCFSCGWTIPSVEYMKSNGWLDEEEDEPIVTREALTEDEKSQVKKMTSQKGQGYRGIRDDTSIPFGVRYEYDTETGEPVAQYVPTTINAELVGYRVRRFPKDFKGSIGQVGKEVDLVGQFRFLKHNKTVVIVGGEVDMLSAYQMLADATARSNAAKGTDYEPPAVVSSTLGEAGTFKQVQAQYDWFNQFQKIIVCTDSDEAGQEAAEKIVSVLPPGKAYVMKMTLKDPNEHLQQGKEREFVQAFWNAKPYVPAGVKTAADAFDGLEDELNRDRITLPAYMHKLQAMMGGGIRQGRMCNVIADTSVGKTTHVRRMVYHWIFNSPVTPTIVSLEDTGAQYILDLISVHMEENFSWIRTELEILEWSKTEEGQRVKHELCYKDDGTPRFYIIDEREGDIKAIEDQMQLMYRKHGSKLFVIDVLTDLLRGTNAEKAEDHMNVQKNFLKEGVTIINVHHTRKPQANKDGEVRKVSEYDVLGTGSFVQSAAYNILLHRDKMAEDPLVRNTTEVELPKCRGGKTGSAGSWYYDFDKVKCHDFDDWVRANGPKDV